MEKQIDRKTIWNEGAVAGLVFGAISIAYMIISTFTGKLGTGKPALAALISVLNVVLWAAKFFGCIYLMKALMKKFAAAYPDAGNSDTFRYGVVTAVLSALLYSGAYLAYILFIQPDMLSEAMDTVMQSYSSMLDSNSISEIENMKGSLPQITFFSNLFYCSIYGTILSAILSRNIPSRNPFDIKEEP